MGWTRDGNPDCMRSFPASLNRDELRAIVDAAIELKLTVAVKCGAVGQVLEFRCEKPEPQEHGDAK